MKYRILFLLLCSFYKTFGQTFIIGDSSGKTVVKFNLKIPINATAAIDLDGDGLQDISFTPQQTNFPIPPNWPVSETNFPAEIQAITTNLPGYKPEPAVFNDNDSVYLKNANWNSPVLNCGNGRNGLYGQTFINQTIVLRKTSIADTSYFFLKLTFLPAKIIIHEVISERPAKVLSVIGEDGKEKLDEVLFYPNPFTDRFTASIFNGALYDFQVIDLQGKSIKTFLRKTSGQLDLADLPPGSYVLRYTNSNSSKSILLVKN